MRSIEEIRGMAGAIKVKMLRRIPRINQCANTIGLAAAGMANDVKPDRLKTIKDELDNLAERQRSDGIAYAALRWALEITEDIEDDNLDLDS